MMRRLFLIAAISVVGIFGVGMKDAIAETETACTRSGDGGIIVVSEQPEFVTDNLGNTGDSCKEVPDFYKVTFYRLGLCKADPIENANSLASCILLLNDDAGVEHVIQGTGNSTDLDTSSAGEMVPGTYPFMVMILKNELSIKHTETFSVSSGNGLIGKNGQGTTCWTTDAVTSFTGLRSGVSEPSPSSRSTLGMDCGTAAQANPQYTTEIFDSMGDGDEPFSARLEDDPVLLLQQDNITTATDEENGARILAVLPVTAVVTPSSSFDLTFTLTDSVSIDMTEDQGEIFAIKNGADPFQVNLSVNN